MWSPKGVNKIFPSQLNTNRRKTLVANVSFRNQNEENAFGPAMAIFPLTNKVKYKQADEFSSTSEKPRRTNRMLTIHPVSCDFQMFQVNFIPSLVPDWKTVAWVFALHSKRSFLLHSRRSTDSHVGRTRPQPCSISRCSPLNHPQYVCSGKLLKKHGDEASHWS